MAEALAKADVAISKTGTITLECAFYGVPTVAMYIASGLTYQIGRHIVKVKWASMPNLIANEEVFPEFIQQAATPENISHAALQLLQNKSRREKVRMQMAGVVAKLGTPKRVVVSRRQTQSLGCYSKEFGNRGILKKNLRQGVNSFRISRRIGLPDLL